MSSNSSDVGEDQPRNSLTSIDSVQSDEVAEEKTPTTPKVLFSRLLFYFIRTLFFVLK